jgi:hypothetical protein
LCCGSDGGGRGFVERGAFQQRSHVPAGTPGCVLSGVVLFAHAAIPRRSQRAGVPHCFSL